MTQRTINLGTADQGNGDPIRTAFSKVNDNFTELYAALGLDGGTLNIGAFEFSGSTMSTTDSSGIKIDQATDITSDLTVGGDILPNVANGGDLGSAAKPWRSLYVSNNTIYIGGNTLGLDNEGNLAWNGSTLAHADGEFIRLDALTDVNAPSPNAGDTLAWMGSQYVNVPLREDRLHSEGDEVVLVGGANPYVTFPAITGGDQLIIQGAEVSSVTGSLALTSQNNLNIIANGSGAAPGGSKNWTFGDDGSLTIPGDIRSEQEINIDINLGDSTLRRWTFGEDGVLNAPASSGLYNANLFDIRSQSDYTAWVRTSGQTGLASINSTGVANVAKVEAISQQPAHVDITVESSGQGSKVWSFDYVGSLTIPGGILSIDHLNLDADYDNGYSVYIGSNHPTAGTLGGVVIGDTRGGFVEIITTKLIIGQTSVPTHSYGSPGDIEGEVAFDNNYIYYCKQNYVNNSTDIWVRVGWTSSNW